MGGAFEGCTSLISITIPSTVSKIDDYSFHNCTSLSTLSINSGSVSLSIGSYAFDNTALTNLSIPTRVKSIGSNCFQSITALKSVYINDGLTQLSSEAFRNCTGLKTLRLPSTLTKIEGATFRNCSSLTNISIPSGVTKIEHSWVGGAFEDCTSVVSLTLPNSLTIIDEYTFYNCSSLTSITVPSSVTVIGNAAFGKCASLTKINIPRSVTTLSGEILQDSKNVTIYGIAGSNIDLYAKEHNIPFVATLDSIYNVNAIPSTNFIKITWSRVQGAEGYIIYRQPQNGVSSYLAMVKSATITAYNDIQASKNIKYTYRVYPYYTSNGKRILGPADSYARAVLLGYVSGIKASVTGSRKVTLSWSDIPNADGYIIYRQIGNNSKFSYRYMVQGTSYTDTTASNYIYNFYRIYPYYYDENGVRRVGNSNKYVYARPTLTSVKNLKASENGTQIKLTWSSVSSADGYIIYRKEGNGAFKYRYMVTGTSYTDLNAPIGKYNFYRVYPYEYVNHVRYVGPSTSYVYGKPTLKAVTNLKAIGQSKAVKITWTASTRATGYFVYKKGSNGKFGYIGYTNGTSYIDKKASKNTYNFYRVYPYYKPTKNSQRVMGPSNAYVYAKAK